MIDPLPRELNLANLKFVTSKISNLEYCVFFGTLLGFQREGNIIEGDDDIDIYVNSIHREEILNAFIGSELQIDTGIQPNLSPYFLQGTRIIDGMKTFVDFYFYHEDKTAGHVIERWNFAGKWKNPKNAIHIPREIFYPITATTMQGINIKTPHDPAAICEFLYGDSWMTPMKKKSQYKTKIINNRPKLMVVNNRKKLFSWRN